MATTATGWLRAALLCTALLAGCDDGMPVPGDDDAGDDDDDDAGDDDTASGDDDSGGACGGPLDPEPGTPDGSCTSTEPYEQFDPQMDLIWQWTTPTVEVDSVQVMMTPIVIDLDDDNADGDYGSGDVPDVVFLTGADNVWITEGVMRAVRGDDGSELWTYTDHGFATAQGIAAGELEPASPGPEIVAIADTGDFVCLAADGTLLWTMANPDAANFGSYVGSFALHDMDHDGVPEIIWGRVIFGPGGVLHGVGEYGWGRSRPSMPITYAVDLDGDGVLEVVTGNAAYHKDGSAVWTNDEQDGTTAVGDFDLDGDPEVVVSAYGTIRLQDHQGNVLWGPNATLGNTDWAAPPTVADFDGDGSPEIGMADKNFYQVYDGDGSLLWSRATTETSSGTTGSSVFDFNGDGTAEVVYADEEDFFIFEGPTGDVLFQESQHASGTVIEYPLVVDVNGDEAADIVLPSNDYAWPGWNAVTAFTGTNESGWWATRQIWNQHAYFVTNVGDDGTIPTYQQDPWEVHNSFRQARPATGWGGYPTPDVIPVLVEVCDEGCPDERTVVARVRNRGAANTSGGVPVTLWDDSGTTLLATAYTAGPVTAGWTSESFELTFDPADAGGGDLLLRADGLSTGAGLIHECDEDNNELVIEGSSCP